MALFRPYEQGKTEAEPEKGRRRRGASRAARPEERTVEEGRVLGGPVDTSPAASTPKQQAAASDAPTKGPRQPQKKGTRTPTRAEAQAARMERLHPTLSPKEQRRASREAERQARMRNLDSLESTPARRLIRDHVDSRLTITEFTIPLMLVILAITMAFAGNYQVQSVASMVMVALFLLWIVNIFWTRHTLRKVAAERGIDVRQRGMGMYLVNRMMTLRMLRRPAPAVRRGESY